MKTCNKVLPMLVNGEQADHKEDLKQYKLKRCKAHQKPTLYSVYQYYSKDPEEKSFSDYLEMFCKKNNIPQPYKIVPLCMESLQWKDIVKKIVSEETVESIIANVAAIAMGDSKQSLRAAELIAEWWGATKSLELTGDLNVDSNVTVKPPLFELPDGEE